jgi:hypothetical protein
MDVVSLEVCRAGRLVVYSSLGLSLSLSVYRRGERNITWIEETIGILQRRARSGQIALGGQRGIGVMGVILISALFSFARGEWWW